MRYPRSYYQKWADNLNEVRSKYPGLPILTAEDMMAQGRYQEQKEREKKNPSFTEQAEEVIQTIIDSKYRLGSLSVHALNEKVRLHRDVVRNIRLHGTPYTRRKAFRELLEKYGKPSDFEL